MTNQEQRTALVHLRTLFDNFPEFADYSTNRYVPGEMSLDNISWYSPELLVALRIWVSAWGEVFSDDAE